MKRISGRQTLKIVSEISLTPLLASVLLLMMLFLLAFSFVRKEEPVRPATTAILAVSHDQAITLDGSSVAQSALLENLKQRVAKEPGLGVVVKIDHKLPVHNLLEIMGVLKDAGVPLTAVAPTSSAQQP